MGRHGGPRRRGIGWAWRSPISARADRLLAAAELVERAAARPDADELTAGLSVADAYAVRRYLEPMLEPLPPEPPAGFAFRLELPVEDEPPSVRAAWDARLVAGGWRPRPEWAR